MLTTDTYGFRRNYNVNPSPASHFEQFTQVRDDLRIEFERWLRSLCVPSQITGQRQRTVIGHADTLWQEIEATLEEIKRYEKKNSHKPIPVAAASG